MNGEKIKELIEECDAVVIGAGAGLSTAAGVNYGSKDFAKLFPELVLNYHFTDMYTSSFYIFETEEERWSYWAKHIDYLCLSKRASSLYKKLYNLVKDKDYFVVTTNVDRQFIKAGFEEKRVFEVQGSLTKIQCARACHDKLYDDTKIIKEMIKENKNTKVPSHLVPKCPVCGGKMDINLRKNDFFVEDDEWNEHKRSYEEFLNKNKNRKLLFIELGVGFNTPGIIRFPFEELTHKYASAFLIRINDSNANIPYDIKHCAIGVKANIKKVIDEMVREEE